MLDLIQTRRDLHQIPEIGLQEFKTHAYLLNVITVSYTHLTLPTNSLV